MNRPDDIPEDVWDRAAVVNAHPRAEDPYTRRWLAARAILAERASTEEMLKDPIAVRLNWQRGGINADSIIADERDRAISKIDAKIELARNWGPHHIPVLLAVKRAIQEGTP